MEHTYQYAWIMPFVLLPVPIAIGVGYSLFQRQQKTSALCFFPINLSIQKMNGSSIYQYLWSWAINNDFSLEFGDLIDPLTYIMLILITTVGIMVLIYSDNYMSNDEGYLRFFAYMSFSNTSMLGLVTSSNLIQIYIFWELVGMCSYLLIGFRFTRPIATNAWDFGLLLGILGLYWITGSFEFRDLFKIVTNLIENNGLNSLFLTLCAALLFLGAVAKSAQFPLHVWLPDAMEGPTPISALIHAATTVIPYIMNLISLIGIITVLLGPTLALAQRDIKRRLAYSTMSQLGYIISLFHLITHSYSKALLFLGSRSIIHCMESIVGYSPNKSQNICTLSLCGIPPLACFWSKDEILSDSWVYSPIFAIIAYFTAGLTAFYMFQMYLLTFAGHLNVYSQNFNAKKTNHFIQYPSGVKKDITYFFFPKKAYSMDRNVKKGTQPLITFTHFKNKENNPYPYESENTMLFPLLILGFATLFVGFIGIPFDYRGMDLNILSI
ncbi:hypothetical protein MKW92_021161, partial [Papaver armeniacum]